MICVVVPTYNEAQTLPILLEGLLALPEEYEVLVVDDASPDRTAELALAMAAEGDSGSTAVAEQYRRLRRPDAALEAYQRSMARWEEAAKGDVRHAETARAAIALARAGRARVLYQQGRDAEALEEMLASFQGSPETAGTRDGMGVTPGETAQMLYARLKTGGQAEAAARLEAALRAIDPELLRPDRE